MSWRWFTSLRARLRALARGRRADDDLDDELAFHVAMETRTNVERGMTEGVAERLARASAGGLVQAKEACRDVRPLRWLLDVAVDVRYAVRVLFRAPAFSLLAMLTLALGIGGDTAMFSVLDTYLFRPLPYPQPDRIVRVFRTSIHSQSWPHSAGSFFDQQAQNTVFEHMAAYSWSNPSLIDDSGAERLQGMRVTASFFPTLGVPAAHGRWFTDDEDRAGTQAVAVVSDRLWRRRFGGDPAIVGCTVQLDADRVTIVGVMPPAFDVPLLWGAVDVWRPMAFTAEQRRDRQNNYLGAFGRLKPGVSIDQAQSAMSALAVNIVGVHQGRDESLRVEPAQLSMSDEVSRRVMWFTFGLAVFVLLIACANLANLQLVRTMARGRELEIRAALGASRWRLLRQSLTESLLVAGVGGVLSVALAVAVAQLISRRLFVDMPGAAVTLDVRVLAFALACAVTTGLVFGTMPAWVSSRADGSSGTSDRLRGPAHAHRRLRGAFVVSEIAFAIVLLAGAGLFLRGVQRFARRDPGWRVDDLLTAQLDLRGPKYATPAQRLPFYRDLESRLRALPGVSAVALSASQPAWGFSSSGGVVIEGRPDPGTGHWPEVYFEQVSLGYFETLDLSLMAGRRFDAGDTGDHEQVVVINETMARQFWPNERAIGKRITRDVMAKNPGSWLQVVGVVRDVEFAGSLNAPFTRLQAYRPLAQAAVPQVTMLLRTSTPPDALGESVRRAAAGLDPMQAVYRIRTARTLVDQQLGSVSLLAELLAAFGGLGLVLAAVGVYGVTSYSVVQRTSEFGIRMALGAGGRDVLWLVLANGARLVAAGVAVGSVGAFTVSRLLESLVPMLPTRDPAALAGSTLGLAAIAVLACYVPAARAVRLNPAAVLRHE